jgi:hypothetical protein
MDDGMDDGMDEDSSGFRACFISSPQNASYIDVVYNYFLRVWLTQHTSMIGKHTS